MTNHYDKIAEAIKKIRQTQRLIEDGLCRPDESDAAYQLAKDTTNLFTDDIFKRKAEALKAKHAFTNVRKSAPFVPKEETNRLNEWLHLLDAYVDNRKVKAELSSSQIHVQSVVDGEDQHIFITEKGSKDHAHLILDGTTGEIRVDKKDQVPNDIIKSMQAQLHLKTGETVQITRSSLSFAEPQNPQPDVRAYAANKDGYFVVEIYNNGDEDLENFIVRANWTQPSPEGAQERIIDKFNDTEDYLVMARPRSLNMLKQGARVYATGIPSISVNKKVIITISCKGMKTGKEIDKVFELDTPSQY